MQKEVSREAAKNAKTEAQHHAIRLALRAAGLWYAFFAASREKSLAAQTSRGRQKTRYSPRPGSGVTSRLPSTDSALLFSLLSKAAMIAANRASTIGLNSVCVKM